MTALENAMLPALIARRPRREARERAAASLAEVGLGDRMNHRPGELSGGEQQRVAVARAIMNGPRIILADEPTGNLDPDTARDILMLMRDEIRSNGASAILVTHSRAAAATADHVLLLTKDGLHPLPANSGDRPRAGDAGGS
jgi:putative ABC transport system ATP-binding protein